MNIIIMGPQGSGKGTQANLLSRKLNIPHIDAGKMLREEVLIGTEIGNEIKKVLEKGDLIPAKIAPKLLKNRIAKEDCENGFILDGFPRDVAQAEFLDSIADINLVIELNIDDALALKRLLNRWECTKCSAIYGIDFPPRKKGVCNVCGGKLVKRSDDKPALIKKRLKVYHEKTEPLIEYYKPRDFVIRIDASRSAADVFKKILLVVTERLS